MERKFRLTRSTDFQRVRRSGRSYAHPLLVLVVSRSQAETLRIGVAAGRNIGNAVKRNRAKRRLRAALSPFCTRISPSWDMIFIARKPISAASFDMIQDAVKTLLLRARVMEKDVT